jgi:predicted DNA-binding transcriptional regulator AlpA
MHRDNLPVTIGTKGLAQLLEMSTGTIYNYLSSYPDRVPPPCPKATRRGKLMWLTDDVLAWIKSQKVEPVKRPGRHKSEAKLKPWLPSEGQP